ncbi:hypothetical protein [Dyella silvatica]|uniref:hypothetical protein n=1 Tax=Dyella silvatica TaxID=2992128 RepID=UPI00225A1649|nr:hypothetical protein [Dyella silvatica]
MHVFSDSKAQLKAELEILCKSLNHAAAAWISWPKKTAKLPTDITDNTIREVALALGFVDIKVCAVSELCSGLKRVIRKELR